MRQKHAIITSSYAAVSSLLPAKRHSIEAAPARVRLPNRIVDANQLGNPSGERQSAWQCIKKLINRDGVTCKDGTNRKLLNWWCHLDDFKPFFSLKLRTNEANFKLFSMQTNLQTQQDKMLLAISFKSPFILSPSVKSIRTRWLNHLHYTCTSIDQQQQNLDEGPCQHAIPPRTTCWPCPVLKHRGTKKT